MEYLKLIGIVIIVVGFACKLDSILVIMVAAIATALVAGLDPLTFFQTLGQSFVDIPALCIGVFALAFALFTPISSLVGIGVGVLAPFVLALGADPVVVGSVALTCGYCGTLCTPMAAIFNMVPVAILDMKDKNGVIKKQIPIALVMLAVQIVYMIAMA